MLPTKIRFGALLIEKGADVNAKDQRDGNTALIRAVNGGHLDVVKLLLANHADVNVITKSGWTALKWARLEGYEDIVKILKEHGAKDAAMLADKEFYEDLHAGSLERDGYYKIDGRLATYKDLRDIAEAMEESGEIFNGDYKPYSGVDSYIVGLAPASHIEKIVDTKKEAALRREGIKISRTLAGAEIHYYSMPKAYFLELLSYLRMKKFEDAQLVFEHFYRQVFPSPESHATFLAKQIKETAERMKVIGLSADDLRLAAQDFKNGLVDLKFEHQKQLLFIEELHQRGYRVTQGYPSEPAITKSAAPFLLQVADAMNKAQSTVLFNNPVLNGGIDLNKINVLRHGRTVKVNFDQAQLNALTQGGFEGFTFKVESMTRIASPFQLLGINASVK